MSKNKEITDAEFKEIVIGEHGPNIEKTLRQAEDNRDRINAIVNGYNQQNEYLNRLLAERKSMADAVKALEADIRTTQTKMEGIITELQEVSRVVKGNDFKELTRQRTNNEWLWQRLAILFMIAFGISFLISLFR